jgi:hypothetical protein
MEKSKSANGLMALILLSSTVLNVLCLLALRAGPRSSGGRDDPRTAASLVSQLRRMESDLKQARESIDRLDKARQAQATVLRADTRIPIHTTANIPWKAASAPCGGRKSNECDAAFCKSVEEFVHEHVRHSFSESIKLVRWTGGEPRLVASFLASDDPNPIKWEGYVTYPVQSVASTFYMRASSDPSGVGETALVALPQNEYFSLGQRVLVEGRFMQYDAGAGFRLIQCKATPIHD